MDISGKPVLVTGGGSGLGAEVAIQLAQAGARVGVIDINKDGAQAVAAKIGGAAAACDVSDPNAAAAAIAEIAQKHGPARVLVNCAGIGNAKRILGKDGPSSLQDFEKVIRVNLIGSFNMLRLAAADMSKLEPLEDGERGVIISTASVAAYEGQIGQASYAASKGGIVSMTLPAARELAQFGIRVLAIAPGLFKTPLMETLPPEIQKSLGDSVPFPRRLGSPAEFAALVGHIIVNRSLNGEVIRLDGALRLAPR